MKPQSNVPRHQFLSRTTIKQVLGHFNHNCISDIVRIKKPQNTSRLIGQLFCMLLWVCRES